MRELTEIRKEIDRIDREVLSLFQKRMECAAQVAEYKRGTGKAITILSEKRKRLMN